MITPTLGAVIRPSVSLSKLSTPSGGGDGGKGGKSEFVGVTVIQKQQTLPPNASLSLSNGGGDYEDKDELKSNYHTPTQTTNHHQVNIHDNYMAHILSDPGAIRSLDDVRIAQMGYNEDG